MRTIYDGVDVDAFHPDPDADVERGALLFVGNAEDYNKGVVYAIRTLAILPPEAARLYIVGGPAGEPRVASAEARRLGVEDRVTIVGRVMQNELAGWYRRAQIVVSPSLYEGFGLPAAEAMACGTPVVASDGGALPEVVADGETGLIVPAGDARALADALGDLLADPARCVELGTAGYRRVIDKFTWPRTAERTEALYGEVLAARAVSASG
jgi:glycosyltransferase involved in cell wall biosynthesis